MTLDLGMGQSLCEGFATARRTLRATPSFDAMRVSGSWYQRR